MSNPEQGDASTNGGTTIGLAAAAELLFMSQDSLMRKARRGIIPGAKPGRAWIFIKEDLLAFVRKQAKERADAAAIVRPAVESALQSPAKRLADRLERQIADKRRLREPA